MPHFAFVPTSDLSGRSNSQIYRRLAYGLAGSPTTTNGAQYLGSACSGCWSIIASMDLRSASACESFGSAASAAKVPVIKVTALSELTSQFETISERAPA